jgi:PAS domain S-box-containing protein
LRPIRFNHGRGYYFAFNYQGIEELFPDRPEMEGQDMLPIQGARGEFVVKDMLGIVKANGDGFYEYTWTKPNREGHFPKIAYVQAFAPFGWVLGTGEYLDDAQSDIQQEVIGFMEQFRIGKQGYLFAGRWDGLSLCGPEKGKNMWDVADAQGNKIVQQMIAMAQGGSGYLTYGMPDIDNQRPAPKLSYVVGIPEWQWYIGTGIYIEEIETVLAKKKEEVNRQIVHYLLQMAAVLTGLMVFVGLVAFQNLRKARRNLETFSGFFAKAGMEPVEIDPERMDFAELQELAGAANHMVRARKAMEAALVESEAKYRYIVENAPIGIFQRQVDGGFRYANPGLLKQFHCDTPELFLARYGDIRRFWAHPEQRDAFTALLIKEGKCFGLEVEVRLVDGETKWFSLYASLDGSQKFINGFSLDISDRKRAETERERLQAQLLQAQKMESIGRLAGGTAHDFNNMLSVILGYSELAMFQLDAQHPVHANLVEISNAAKKSANLTQQLLAFARKQPIAPKMLDLNETIEGMLKMLRRLIGEDIDLTWLPGTKLWPVKMDQSQIDQILANLCVNARDAINGVGKVSIATHNAVWDAADCARQPDGLPGDYACLTVSDSGCGMDAATQEKIFEPFFTTKDVNKGTGLGLATVYGIVKQNNGFIHVRSAPGQGTEFTIHLPRFTGQAIESQVPAAAPVVDKGRETILVVEDEAAILDLVKTMLTPLGYAVLTAGAPDEALGLMDSFEGEIHLLVSDIIMPKMNGWDLAQRIQAKRPGIKCLFITGYMASVIADRGILEQGFHILRKPFSLGDLASKIRQVLGREAPCP